jgi:hypothetical protein
MEGDLLRPWLMTMVEIAHDSWTLIAAANLLDEALGAVAQIGRGFTHKRDSTPAVGLAGCVRGR